MDMPANVNDFGAWYDESGQARGNRSRLIKAITSLSGGESVAVPGFDGKFPPMIGVTLTPRLVLGEDRPQLLSDAKRWAPNKRSAHAKTLPEGARVDRSNGFALVHPLIKYRAYVLDRARLGV